MDGMRLNELQMSALGEIANIGAGNASTSLAKMTNQLITLALPDTRVTAFEDLPLMTSAKLEEAVVSAYVAFEGDVAGCIVLLFSQQQAAVLLDLLGLPSCEDLLDMPELQQSAIAEMGNLITSAYLNALASFTGLRLLPMPPGVGAGMAGALLNTIGAHLGQFETHGIVVQVRVYSPDVDLGLDLLMMPQASSLQVILNALGIGDAVDTGYTHSST